MPRGAYFQRGWRFDTWLGGQCAAFADVLDKVGLSTASRPPLAATACRVAETAQYVEEGVASAAEVERIELAIYQVMRSPAWTTQSAPHLVASSEPPPAAAAPSSSTITHPPPGGAGFPPTPVLAWATEAVVYGADPGALG